MLQEEQDKEYQQFLQKYLFDGLNTTKPYFVQINDFINKADDGTEENQDKIKNYLLNDFQMYSLNTKVTFGYKYCKNKENDLRGRSGNFAGWRVGTRDLSFVQDNKIPTSRNKNFSVIPYWDMGRQAWRCFKKDMFIVMSSFWSKKLNKWVDTPEEAGLKRNYSSNNYKYKRVDREDTPEEKKKAENVRKAEAAKRAREILKTQKQNMNKAFETTGNESLDIIVKGHLQGLISKEQCLKALINVELLKGGKKGFIGEIRVWDGKKYVKHSDGWVLLNENHNHTIEDEEGEIKPSEQHHVDFAKEHLSNELNENSNQQEIVEHAKFGRGTVTDRSSDGSTVTINFDSVGEKKLLTAFAKLTPVLGSMQSVQSTGNGGVTQKVEEKSPSNLIQKPIKEKKPREIKMVPVDYKIIHETDKAYRISKDNKQVWIPKAWVDETEGDTIKSVKNRWLSKINESFDDIKEIQPDIETDKFTISKETEKAYLVDMKIKQPNGEEKDIQEWFPKSKVSKKENGGLKINHEFFQTKENDLRAKYGATEIRANKSGLVTKNKEGEEMKTVGIPTSIYEEHSDQEVRRTMWFPKSQITIKDNSVIVPNWLYEKQMEELMSSFNKQHGGYYYPTHAEPVAPEIVKSMDLELEESILQYDIFIQSKNRIFSLMKSHEIEDDFNKGLLDNPFISQKQKDVILKGLIN